MIASVYGKKALNNCLTVPLLSTNRSICLINKYQEIEFDAKISDHLKL